MFSCIKFLSIFAYTILIFFFEGPALLGFFAANIAAMAVTKVTPKTALRNLVMILPFVLLAAAFNLILGYVKDAIILSARLFLVCNMTLCYKKAVSMEDLTAAVEILFSPLKVFKIKGKDVGLMVCIALAFIPVLRRDFKQIRLALCAKGMKMTIKNATYLLIPFFVGILQRTDEIAKAIRTKGYDE
jgi:energy-coupling factor transport system permease protein